MPRNKENESVEEIRRGNDDVPQRGRNPGRDPDDRKESERSETVGRRGDEHEDVEESRAKSRSSDPSSDADEEELSEADLMEIDLDAPPEDQGPDA